MRLIRLNTIAFLLALGSTCALQAAAGPTNAPPGSSVPLADALTGDALQAYTDGRLLYAAKDFPGALAKFKSAYEASKEVRLLWNLATCEKEQRHYALAARWIERYLKDGGTLIPAARQAEARESLAALLALTSPVLLEGVPAGAAVFVDELALGQAPLELPLVLDSGSHTLRIEANGYKPFKRTLEIPGKTEVRISVDMVPAPEVSVSKAAAAAGQLTIETGVDQAQIRIDGARVGEGRWVGVLSPGKHHVTVKADGKEPYSSDLELARGESRSLGVHLENEKRAWPWIVGGTAVLLVGGVIGGYFLFAGAAKDPEVQGPSGSLGGLSLASF